MNRDELKKKLLDPQTRRKVIGLPGIKDLIIKFTPKYEGEMIAERTYWLINDMDDYLQCQVCDGKITRFRSSTDGYTSSLHCGMSCMNKSYIREEAKLKRILTSMRLYGTEYPNQNTEVRSRCILKCRVTKEATGNIIPEDQVEAAELYARRAWGFTNKALLLFQLPNIEKRGNRHEDPNAWELDHRYSIARGFLDGVPPEIIGSFHNLEMLPWKKNASKRAKCSITLEDLLDPKKG